MCMPNSMRIAAVNSLLDRQASLLKNTPLRWYCDSCDEIVILHPCVTKRRRTMMNATGMPGVQSRLVRKAISQ